MTWELVATWIALGISIGTMVFAMGKQTQKIEFQQTQIDNLRADLRDTQELPVQIATLETDMKYLIKELSEVKTLLQRKMGV